jgi:hypothetical protein
MGNMINEIKISDIKDVDLNNMFLHYTSKANLKDIFEKGLEPRIGMNARLVETSKKVFFSVGDKGALVIMDVWLKWLIFKPTNNYLYWFGAFLLRIPCFPKIFHKMLINYYKKSKKKHLWAYKKLNEILNDSVYLILDLKENLDFSFNDIDEAKQLYRSSAKYIKDIYAHDSDFHDPKIEYWNMHTYSNKIIEKEKISLLKAENKYTANDILLYMARAKEEYVNLYCPFLKEYIGYLRGIKDSPQVP